MLTPQELQNKKFEKAVFGGYDMAQVDDFLDSIINDYTEIYKENITLKGKMKVLVDKIEEYRSVDDEIRKMLYTAQSKSKELIANAEKEAVSIVSNAKSAAESSIIELKNQYLAEQDKLAAMKSETAAFAEQMKSILRKNIELLDAYIEAAPPKQEIIPPKEEEYKKASPDTFEFELPKDFIVDKGEEKTEEKREEIPVEPQTVSEKVGDIKTDNKNVDLSDTKFFEVQLGRKEERAHKRTVQEADEGSYDRSYKPSFRFNDLKFGKNYDYEEEGKTKGKKK